MASGSEAGLIVRAAEILEKQKVKVRLVSMPCMDLFAEQPEDYRQSVLPNTVRARVAVEAASSLSWGRYVGLDGACICLDNFGESAPADRLFDKYGFTVENVAATALKVLNK